MIDKIRSMVRGNVNQRKGKREREREIERDGGGVGLTQLFPLIPADGTAADQRSSKHP
jgi:hypothetical protein